MKNSMKVIMICLVVLIFLAIAVVSLNLFPTKDTKNMIYVLNLYYDRGNITLVDIFTKIGYSPDRKIQPETGYRCEVVSKGNTVLYSFRFEIPIEVNAPPPLENESSESVIYLEKVNFTLLMPYFKNAKSIDVYSPSDEKMLSVDVSGYDSMMKSNSLNIYIVAVAAILIIVLIALFFLTKKSDKWSDVYKKWKK